MSTPDDGEGSDMSGGAQAWRRNPFRPMAVADTGLIGHYPDRAEVAVRTGAREDAFRHLDDYLGGAQVGDQQADEGPRRGVGVTIVLSGDYGVGKTHLAIRMVDHARTVLDEDVRALYLVAARGGFLSLFRQFLAEVTEAELVRQVQLYYLDAVEQAMADADIPPSELADPADVSRMARRYDLLESGLTRKVQQTLAAVTDDPAFTTAMSLLLEDGLSKPVWDWLMGGEPGHHLRNRGVHKRIDDDLAAIEALSVLALLLGGRDRRFVLAVDEVSGIFARSNGPEEQLMEAFRTLLEAAGRSGACFILCGLPDFMPYLPQRVSVRITHHLRLGGFTEADIVEFILTSHERTFGRREFAPFSAGAERTIRDFTKGNARAVARLLHQAFLLADAGAGAPAPITDELLYQAAYELTPPTIDTVAEEVRRVAAQRGWQVREEQVLPGAPGARVELRVSSAGREDGCAVLVLRALLSTKDVDRVRDWVAAVPGPRLLVTVGNPSSTAAAAAGDLLGAEPLVHRGSFGTDLAAALHNVLALAPQGESDPLDRLSAQVKDLTRVVAGISAGSREPDLRALAEEVADRVAGRLTEATERPARPETLPDSVAALFERAEQLLVELTRFDDRVAESFRRTGYDAAATLRPLLGESRVRLALGAADVFSRFVRQFRGRVAEWFQAEPDRGSAADLREICDVYEAMTDHVAVSELAPLAALAPRRAGAIGAVTPIERATESLGSLAADVRKAALRVAGTA
ncbi:hypothetical protein [Actinokineospora sp. NBRC 105648]|uniref:hypothetical protein n=1 Tax=Actinokineospora sp. NBRC 105648 TaxID=3032206 RepID=UPI0024A1A699|nr:hypothetical protein [Actinokineospora sp. NBRC 105648]GLZ41965.1 hypothetical protein Acsp05_55890 [Actinokineospora sp. NBRC 105648]